MKIGTIGYRIECVARNRLLSPQNLSSKENIFSQLLDFIHYIIELMEIETIGYRIESVAGNRLLFPQNLSSNENTFSQLLDFILYHQTNGNRND